jgi:hypothetical protein
MTCRKDIISCSSKAIENTGEQNFLKSIYTKCPLFSCYRPLIVISPHEKGSGLLGVSIVYDAFWHYGFCLLPVANSFTALIFLSAHRQFYIPYSFLLFLPNQ